MNIVDIFNNIISSYWFSVIIKLILGAILCGAIGLERQAWNKPAGFKTHTILGMCGVFIMLLSEYIYFNFSQYGMSDVTRIPAQLITGIGFIGAGTILRDGLNVKGLTTAAGLLAVTCIGLAVGAGFYLGAILGTIIIYAILSHSQIITDRLVQDINVHFTLQVNDIYEGTINDVKDILVKNDIKINYIKCREDGKKENSYIKIKGKYREGTNINNIISTLMALESVDEVTQELKDD